MIIVKVELHSSRTGRVSELARMMIVNDGTGNTKLSNYIGQSYRGRSKEQLDKRTIMKQGTVLHWSRQRYHVWNLVREMLTQMGYTNG